MEQTVIVERRSRTIDCEIGAMGAVVCRSHYELDSSGAPESLLVEFYSPLNPRDVVLRTQMNHVGGGLRRTDTWRRGAGGPPSAAHTSTWPTHGFMIVPDVAGEGCLVRWARASGHESSLVTVILPTGSKPNASEIVDATVVVRGDQATVLMKGETVHYQLDSDGEILAAELGSGRRLVRLPDAGQR